MGKLNKTYEEYGNENKHDKNKNDGNNEEQISP